MDGASGATLLDMHGIIKYLLDTRNHGLKIEPTKIGKKLWDIICFNDSDCAENPVKRRKISVGVLEDKSSEKHGFDKLRNEWEALLKAIKEVMFTIQLGSMKTLVKFPVMVKLDNVGAIVIAVNFTAMSHMIHVHLCNKYVEDQIVKIVFKSIENESEA